MGIGRRKFLQFLSISLAGLVIDPLKAVAINSDYYVNKKFGFLLTKPKGWDFVSVKDFGKLQVDQVLSDEFEPNKNEVWQEIGDPVLVITKYGLDIPEFNDKFSPTITVFISHKKDVLDEDDEDYDEYVDDFEKIVGMVDYGTSKLFKDYKSIKNITPYSLSNCNGFESIWTWTFESIEHQKSYLCKTWSILIEKGDYFYSFNMIDSQEANEIETAVFETFVKSIKVI